MSDGARWMIAIAFISLPTIAFGGTFLSPLLISGGFFGGAPRTAGGPAAPLVKLVPVGAVVLGITTLGVGIGLLVPA